MAEPTTASKIRTLGPGTLKGTDTGGRDFSADVTKVVLTPSTSTDDPITFLDGSEEVSTSTTWTLEATVQDDYSTDGVNNWCLANAGQKVPMQFKPTNAGGSTYTFDATITPVAIGGDVKAKNANDISWPITNLQLASTNA